ncbi:hypothetical protein BWQ96_04014 [Gracilariopsis chorda]|uniref:Uncharacterized protein n=1 Tax=Gracilariopsis chorda TaxID=448386 RepID=A0A2V3IVW3_9FLOR|nr:hypothetical protein BWQ96_04014 [Gracilariopsis chorda]|eukprot:PXF46229.1 hypothetical protein BWQ96_04014 [Gracilariopsis chorda]
MATKDTLTSNNLCKGQYITQEHFEKKKNLLIHSSITLQFPSIRLILANAPMFGFRMGTTDVTQGYLQSTSKIKQEDYFRHTNEIDLAPCQHLKRLRTVHSLTGSGAYYNFTLLHQVMNDLTVNRYVGDFYLILKEVKENSWNRRDICRVLHCDTPSELVAFMDKNFDGVEFKMKILEKHKFSGTKMLRIQLMSLSINASR